jgi:hypothetical protein
VHTLEASLLCSMRTPSLVLHMALFEMRVGVIAGDRLRQSCYFIKYVWSPPHQHSFFPLTLPSSLAGLTHHTDSLVGDGGLHILVAVAPTVSHVAVPRVGVAGPIFMCSIQLAHFSNSYRRISSSVMTLCFCGEALPLGLFLRS